MKKVNIEFIEDHRWRLVWFMTLIFCLVFFSSVAWFSYQSFQEKQELNHQTQNARLLMPSKVVAVATKQDSRYASSIKAASVLQFDLNKVFSTIENISEPTTRLINLTFDASTGSLRLEYELNSIEVAVVMTEKLNSGYEAKPWQLESLSAARSNAPNGNSSSVTKTIGIWRCQIKDI